MKRDNIFRQWALAAMGQKHGNQKVARLMAYEPVELPQGSGLTPSYTGKIIRRKAIANVLRS